MTLIKLHRQHYSEIESDFRNGMTLREVGEKYGVSRERVRQVLVQRGVTNKDGGVHLKSKIKLDAKAHQKNEKCLKEYGCTHDQFLNIRGKVKQKSKSPLQAFRTQRINARMRGVVWNLTFWDWWNIWQDSGKWELRGRGAGHFCMCRNGDIGAYEKSNVYIGSVVHNSVMGRTLGFERGIKKTFVYLLIKSAGGPVAVSEQLSVGKNYVSQLIARNEIPHSWILNGKAEKLASLTAGSFTYEQIIREKSEELIK